MKFSLIIATVGRKNELLDLIESLKNIDYELSEIEIIIIDQNSKGFLDTELMNIQAFNIKHIHSNKKGLSYNRNLGLQHATGDVICFPDDDCIYYSNTLKNVSYLLSEIGIDFCMGRIYDKKINKNILKKWSNKKFRINRFNSYFLNSSITMFVKTDFVLRFDENLGVGAKFGSCEDADFVYRILKKKAKGVYSPEIEIWHPEPNYQELSLNKVFGYASGFGYFARKNTDLIKVILIFLLIGKKIIQMTQNTVRKRYQVGYFKTYFSGLFWGFKNK